MGRVRRDSTKGRRYTVQGTNGRDGTRGGKQSTNERAVLGEQLVCWPGNQVQVCIKAKGQCSSASWGRWQ